MNAARQAARTVPLLDLSAQHRPLREELLTAMTRVVDSQRFILGDDVAALESEIAAYSGAPYAISCASGSDALYLALLAAGVGPGDFVATVPYSFFATAGSISRTGATPIFADIDPITFNMDPEQLRLLAHLHPRIKAVIPVHLFGACADMDPILEIAAARGWAVIEDGAQSIGAEYKGRKAQSMGDIGCLSFFPSKNLGAFGEGGMCLTANAGLAEKLGALRVHGSLEKYYHRWIGINSRLDTLQAAVLRVKLKHLDRWSEGRARNAETYRRLLEPARLPVALPRVLPYQTRHIYNQFVIRCRRRDELRSFLKDRGIGSEVYYPLPLHLQECYASLGYRPGDFPISEQCAQDSLALPVHADLNEGDVEYVCHQIRAFYA